MPRGNADPERLSVRAVVLSGLVGAAIVGLVGITVVLRPAQAHDTSIICESLGRPPQALCLGDTTPACWRSSTWDWVKVRAAAGLVGRLPSIAEGTILLRDTRKKGGSASDWNDPAHGGACTYVEHTIVHEAGHALGIGWPLNDHPRNPTLSIMSDGYTHFTHYCEPQAYDIVAIMVNYQSR